MKKAVSIILLGLLLLAGCNSSSPASSGQEVAQSTSPSPAATETSLKKDQELIVVNRDIAASLDPVQKGTSSYLRSAGAGEALFRINPQGIVEPSLAEAAKELDPHTWEIKLRPNATFWSGKKVDADAVIASLARSKELDVQASPFLDGIKLEKQDEFTLIVKTERKYMDVPLNLSYYQTLIHNAEAKHDSVATMDMTGPFKVVEFVPKQKLVLERNEGYWGNQPKLKRVLYEEINDEQTRVLSIQSGRSHIAMNVPVTGIQQLKTQKEIHLTTAPAANTQTIYLNLKQPQLQDERVRQALSWSLNREELVALGAEGQSYPVTTWLGSNPAFAEAKNAVYNKYDLERAGLLLDEAGWVKGSDGLRSKEGKPLSIRLMTWGGDKALGEALQEQWTRLGVKAEVQHGDYSLIETARQTGDWDASIEAWSTFGDTYSLLMGQYGPDGGANYGGYHDEEVHKLLAKMGDGSTPEERRVLALQINERVAEQAPMIYLYPRPLITAVHKSLKGFEEHFRQFDYIVNTDLNFTESQ